MMAKNTINRSKRQAKRLRENSYTTEKELIYLIFEEFLK